MMQFIEAVSLLNVPLWYHNAAVNTFTHKSFRGIFVSISVGYILGSEIAGSKNMCIFNFDRY